MHSARPWFAKNVHAGKVRQDEAVVVRDPLPTVVTHHLMGSGRALSLVFREYGLDPLGCIGIVSWFGSIGSW